MTELLIIAGDTFQRRYGRYLIVDGDGPTIDTEDARLLGGELCSTTQNLMVIESIAGRDSFSSGRIAHENEGAETVGSSSRPARHGSVNPQRPRTARCMNLLCRLPKLHYQQVMPMSSDVNSSWARSRCPLRRANRPH
ncbi:hypothetical protein [Microbispora sp. KK1-11]|uniref:hypothetical protein n=1 Tax=Microbispora sp. KK1-11 TaxID=2053005 RepID=UPI00115B626C|nr:hypothetical protein [Microbispora sp. KK1-11]TQS26738.1 hypothetical protein FLW16_24200 [Microbispora sp. KK1-11]